MKVLVDTSVWSQALRRNVPKINSAVLELKKTLLAGKVQMLGPIRQELLSGVKHQDQFKKLAKELAKLEDLPILTEDYVCATRYFNLCRSHGLQGSNTDFLICAVAARTGMPILTTDHDFQGYAK